MAFLYTFNENPPDVDPNNGTTTESPETNEDVAHTEGRLDACGSKDYVRTSLCSHDYIVLDLNLNVPTSSLKEKI